VLFLKAHAIHGPAFPQLLPLKFHISSFFVVIFVGRSLGKQGRESRALLKKARFNPRMRMRKTPRFSCTQRRSGAKSVRADMLPFLSPGE